MNQPCPRCGSTERTKPNKAKPNGVCKQCKKINAQSYYYRTKEKFPGVPTNLTASDKIEIFECLQNNIAFIKWNKSFKNL
jgi:endogenous inhibitor of DNA gyrase (YacG/DUF329 family)